MLSHSDMNAELGRLLFKDDIGVKTRRTSLRACRDEKELSGHIRLRQERFGRPGRPVGSSFLFLSN